MAVLDYSKTGRRGRNSYVPILSRVIDIARLILVQRALWLSSMVISLICTWQDQDTETPQALLSADQELDNIDDGYSSCTAPNRASPPARLALHDQVERMAYEVMIHGMHGPIETLDWRTHGLKIHYNTITLGHIT
ncbi:uncharacterized protein N7500_009665 [Penicillium coprophilum]|uniref:uncharacterized protein n=1 Tax=Penicillium coprophilum TaxID=36646 RepID=UPI00239F289E|nr:uncharacterized protein N7500_009665 [Penicillium coprophilum]KAJ5154226.1 hypothetical protein N7500_009665 [Penicillium coprophilum]